MEEAAALKTTYPFEPKEAKTPFSISNLAKKK